MTTDDNNTQGSTEDNNAAAQKQALLNAIAEKKKEDPLIGLKIGAEEINNRVFSVFTTDKGVNVDAVLTVLAALAGFSCQMAIREDFIKPGKVSEKEAMMSVETNEGRTYYMGGLLNQPLIESKLSVWSLVAGAVEATGSDIPNLEEIASYSAKTLGSEDFGKPRVHEKHIMDENPQETVKNIWPALCPIMDDFCDTAAERPILLGIGLNRVIQQAKDVIDPHTAAILVMDIAVAMSKINTEDVGVEV